MLGVLQGGCDLVYVVITEGVSCLQLGQVHLHWGHSLHHLAGRLGMDCYIVIGLTLQIGKARGCSTNTFVIY